MRVWLWHNGNDVPTLNIVESMLAHPRVHRFHHSLKNRRLREPTNWFWKESNGAYLSKVDDDCLVQAGWAQKLRKAHEDVPELGVVGTWRFQDEDFAPHLAQPRIKILPGGHRLLSSLWVEGSGYLMKRAAIEDVGQIRRGESFTRYCIRLSASGWTNGWYYPLIRQEHMDDPRSPYSLLRTDADLERLMPLSARTFGVRSVQQWEDALRADALHVQRASLDPADYLGWRPAARRLWHRFVARLRRR